MSSDRDGLAGQAGHAGSRVSRVRYRGDHPRLAATIRGDLRLSSRGVELCTRHQDEPILALSTDEISEIDISGAGWFPRLSIRTTDGDATFAVRFHAAYRVLESLGSIDVLGDKVATAAGSEPAVAPEAPEDDATDVGTDSPAVEALQPAPEAGQRVRFTTLRRSERGLRTEPDDLASVTSWPFFVTSTVERIEGDWAYLRTSVGNDGWVRTRHLRLVVGPSSGQPLEAQESPESPEDEGANRDGGPTLLVDTAEPDADRKGGPLDAGPDETQPAADIDAATHDLEERRLGWLTTVQVPASTETPAGHRTCAACGGEWPVDSIFCGNCGSRFDAQTSEVLGNWSDVERDLTTRPDIPAVKARHLTPDAGLQAMVAPDPNAALAPFLSGRVAVLVNETRGSWAQVELDSDPATAGWVDGRKLIPPAQDATPATTTDGTVPAVPGLSGRTSTQLARNWIAGLASAGILLGVLLDWFSFPGTNAFHVPFALLFDYKSPSADPKLAYFLLACGLVGLILSFVEGTRAGRFVCGGGALLFSILFVVWLGHDLPSSVSVTDLMGPGPWVAGISGLILMISPAVTWKGPSVPIGPK